jgi:hypothetical protein
LHADTSTPFALCCDSTATATLRAIPFHTLLVSPLETCGSKTRSAGRPTIGATPGAAGPPPPQRCTSLCPCLLLLYMDRAEGAPAYSQRPRVGRSALGSYVLASIVPPAVAAGFFRQQVDRAKPARGERDKSPGCLRVRARRVGARTWNGSIVPGWLAQRERGGSNYRWRWLIRRWYGVSDARCCMLVCFIFGELSFGCTCSLQERK